MKNLIDSWKKGLFCLFTDDLTSFYSFFTIIFSECVFLRIFAIQKMELFTIILIGYIADVLVCAFFKGIFEDTWIEVLFTILYSIVFVILFIIGCCSNVKISIILTIIPLIITAILIKVREYSCSIFFQFIVIGGPIIVFTITIIMLPTLPMVLKIIIPILYAICAPFISLIEDETAALNIFELAFEIMWSKEE